MESSTVIPRLMTFYEERHLSDIVNRLPNWHNVRLSDFDDTQIIKLVNSALTALLKRTILRFDSKILLTQFAR